MPPLLLGLAVVVMQFIGCTIFGYIVSLMSTEVSQCPCIEL